MISDWKGAGNRVGARTAKQGQCRARMDRLGAGRAKIGLKLGLEVGARGTTRQRLGLSAYPTLQPITLVLV